MKFTNTNNMIDKIKKYINLYQEITKTYSVRILSSAITYNLILIIIPLLMLLNIIMNKLGLPILIKEVGYAETEELIPTIILIINLFWSTSTLVLTFNQTGDTIYYTIKKRGYIRNRISGFIYFFLVVVFVVISVVFVFFINQILKLTDNILLKYFLNFIEFLGNWISIWLISGFIYKKIIPVKISFKKSLMTSFWLTIIWYVLTVIFFPILNYFLTNSYSKIYHSLTSVFVIIYYLYILVKVFIMGIIFQYYLYLKEHKNFTKD